MSFLTFSMHKGIWWCLCWAGFSGQKDSEKTLTGKVFVIIMKDLFLHGFINRVVNALSFLGVYDYYASGCLRYF